MIPITIDTIAKPIIAVKIWVIIMIKKLFTNQLHARKGKLEILIIARLLVDKDDCGCLYLLLACVPKEY